MVVFSCVVIVFFSIFCEEYASISTIQFKNHVFFLSKFNQIYQGVSPLICRLKQDIGMALL